MFEKKETEKKTTPSHSALEWGLFLPQYIHLVQFLFYF